MDSMQMASMQHNGYKYYHCMQKRTSYARQRAATDITEATINDARFSQGRIFWLPPKIDLPERAVRRAHGKGAIEDGIYDHPVVVVSRPAEESHIVHFHLITSFQGKRLDELYPKSNEYQTGVRMWYLPIAPTPDHPDAISKKTRKRFPTLKLMHGTALQKNSYVNIRHVYKIDLSLLASYTNPEAPGTDVYCFEQESMIRMLSKCKTLTMYEPRPQFESLGLKRIKSEPIYDLADIGENEEPICRTESPTSNITSVGSDLAEGDFRMAGIDVDQIAGPSPDVPPDGKRKYSIIPFLYNDVVWPLSPFLSGVHSVAAHASRNPVLLPLESLLIKRPLAQFWRDVKGVTAVAIASI